MGVWWADRLRRVGVCGALLVGALQSCSGQARAPQVGVATELQRLAAAAPTIFVGQIVRIERTNSVVDVTFRVEQAVAGAVGPTCTMREWAGLWPPGQNRYLVGQRVLAFLHAASGAGMSTPVHGAEGLVPVVVQGLNAPKLLDIRRVAASAVRAPETPLPTEADGGVDLAEALALIRPAEQARRFEPVRLVLPRRGQLPVDMLRRQPTEASPVLRGRVQGTGVALAAPEAR